METNRPPGEAQAEAGAAEPGQLTAAQAWARYEAERAEADAAMAISTDLSTDAGVDAQILDASAEAYHGDYVRAWARENHPEATLADDGNGVSLWSGYELDGQQQAQADHPAAETEAEL